ncbi:MAG: hypothetical protein GKS00_20155 [Alphaproteobacteria bacterium]|nr:hypothetical protein [Alphaproteobacteria bacterium]
MFEEGVSRTIVGAYYDRGKGDGLFVPTQDEEGHELTFRHYRENKGIEKHKLTVAEMPGHNHDSGTLKAKNPEQFMHRSSPSEATDDGTRRFGLFATETTLNFGSHTHPLSGNTGPRGKGTSHNNMPPYIALYFCKKD